MYALIDKIQHIELLKTKHTAKNFEQREQYSKSYKVKRIILFALLLYFTIPLIGAFIDASLYRLQPFDSNPISRMQTIYGSIYWGTFSRDWYHWFLADFLSKTFGTLVYVARLILSLTSIFVLVSVFAFPTADYVIKKNNQEK